MCTVPPSATLHRKGFCYSPLLSLFWKGIKQYRKTGKSVGSTPHLPPVIQDNPDFSQTLQNSHKRFFCFCVFSHRNNTLFLFIFSLQVLNLTGWHFLKLFCKAQMIRKKKKVKKKNLTQIQKTQKSFSYNPMSLGTKAFTEAEKQYYRILIKCHKNCQKQYKEIKSQ